MICSLFTRHLYICSLAIGLLATSCQKGAQQVDRLQITTTIAPASRVISEIADTLLTVTTLLPQGNSPENYEPTPQDIQALATSTAYFYMGDLGFERSWVERIHTMQPNLQLVRLDQGLTDRAHHHSHPQTKTLHDPHYWTSVRGLRSMAHTIYTTLSRIDTLHRQEYRTGYDRFSERLSRINREIQAQLTTLPSRAFVIYHPSLTEFACISSSSSKTAKSRHPSKYKHSSRKHADRVCASSSYSRSLTPSSSRVLPPNLEHVRC